jgi:hypothetical protein
VSSPPHCITNSPLNSILVVSQIHLSIHMLVSSPARSIINLLLNLSFSVLSSSSFYHKFTSRFIPQCPILPVVSQIYHSIQSSVCSSACSIIHSPFNSYVRVFSSLFHHKFTTQFISQLEAEYLDAIDNVKAKIQNKKLSC